MANILQYVKDYGAGVAVIISLIAVVVMFIVNARVGSALRKLLRQKDTTKKEKATSLIEAFALIKKLELAKKEDYKNYADEMEKVYSKLYMYVNNPKLILAFNRIMNTFILGNTPSTTEFEGLARKELGLSLIKLKTKQNYFLMLTKEEEKERFRLQKEEEKKLKEQEILRQKELKQMERQRQKELKQMEKEKLAKQKKMEKQSKQIEKKKELKEEKNLKEEKASSIKKASTAKKTTTAKKASTAKKTTTKKTVTKK